MNGTRTDSFQYLSVFLRRIAFMFNESILRVGFVIGNHNTIPRYFGQDGGAGNALGPRVSIRNARIRDVYIQSQIPIH